MVQIINFKQSDFEQKIKEGSLTIGSELKFITPDNGKIIEDLGFLINKSGDYVLIAQSHTKLPTGGDEFSAITIVNLKKVIQYYIYNVPEKKESKDYNLFTN